jgi:hypothetical protein
MIMSITKILKGDLSLLLLNYYRYNVIIDKSKIDCMIDRSLDSAIALVILLEDKINRVIGGYINAGLTLENISSLQPRETIKYLDYYFNKHRIRHI